MDWEERNGLRDVADKVVDQPMEKPSVVRACWLNNSF